MKKLYFMPKDAVGCLALEILKTELHEAMSNLK